VAGRSRTALLLFDQTSHVPVVVGTTTVTALTRPVLSDAGDDVDRELDRAAAGAPPIDA